MTIDHLTNLSQSMLDSLENIAKPGGVFVPIHGHCREIFALADRRLLRCWEGETLATAIEMPDPTLVRRGCFVTPSPSGMLVLAAYRIGQEGRG